MFDQDKKKHKFSYESAYSTKERDMRMSLPKELQVEIPLRRGDRSQEYYRVSERLGNERETVVKLGWRVLDLSRQQVDLGLFCLALLQAEASGPFSFFCVSDSQEQEVKSVWIEWKVMLMASSRQRSTQSLQLSVYNLCQLQILPLLREFFSNYLDWSYMCSQEYQDNKVVRLFENKVVDWMRGRLQKFRVGRDCLQ